jgi:hypothetical protein
MNTSYSYAVNGTLSQINQGLGTTLSVTAMVAQGLGASTAINTSAGGAALTDARSNTTTYTLDEGEPASTTSQKEGRVGMKHAPIGRNFLKDGRPCPDD